MNELIWSLLLLLAGLGLLVLEAFVPSGGVIGVLSVLSIVASIVVAFMGGWHIGLIMLVTTMVVVPALMAAGVKWWPRTPIGRAIVLEPPASGDDVLPETERQRKLQSLVGRAGVAKTKMLPSGVVVIDGETYDAVGEGMAIEPGQGIRVTAVRTNRIVVRLEDLSLADAAGAADQLSQPADSLGLESLEEPPG
jgi:membrane-bound ClpP family serine protease